MKRSIQFQTDGNSLTYSRIWEYDGLQFKTWSGVIAYLKLIYSTKVQELSANDFKLTMGE